MLFGVGPRSCVGSKLGDSQIFMLLCGIVHKFKLTSDNHQTLPSFEEGIIGHTGVYSPKPFKIKFQLR